MIQQHLQLPPYNLQDADYSCAPAKAHDFPIFHRKRKLQGFRYLDVSHTEYSLFL